jgi:beta-galactosidase
MGVERMAGSNPEFGMAEPTEWITHDMKQSELRFYASPVAANNDDRTHAGDRGVGSLQQRAHGVVDLHGAQEPWHELLRRESSPIEALAVQRQLNKVQVLIEVRRDLPAYTLRGYKVRGLFFGEGNLPVERREVSMPDAAPRGETKLELVFTQPEAPVHIQIDVLRPTSFSAYSLDWKPWLPASS